MASNPTVYSNGRHLKPEIPIPPRVREVWALMAQGLNNDEIAARMVLGLKSVQNYVYQVYQSLGLNGNDDGAARVKAALMYWAEVPTF